jgi:hypothetical protein
MWKIILILVGLFLNGCSWAKYMWEAGNHGPYLQQVHPEYIQSVPTGFEFLLGENK